MYLKRFVCSEAWRFFLMMLNLRSLDGVNNKAAGSDISGSDATRLVPCKVISLSPCLAKIVVSEGPT